MDEEKNGDKRSAVERHIQTIVVTATVALLSWVLLSVLDIRDRLIKFEERLATLQGQVNSGVDDRFRGSDWRREKQVLDDRFIRLQNEVEKMDERVRTLERANDKYHGR